MTPVPLPSDRPESSLFTDGLGERVVTSDGAIGELLQILRLRPELTAVPSFEFALRERTARLANFRHAYYSRVRRVDRAMSPTPSLAVVSDHVEGVRLSDILRVARDTGLQLDINAALCLIRQLVPAVALLHENARDVAHGAIAAERLLVTPHARLLIVEHVLGSAIEQLRWSRERLWREFRVAMPPSPGVPRFDHRADVTGIGIVALALVLGRPVDVDEFPNQIPTLLETARERSALGEEQPLTPALRTWLARALQVDSRRAFASAPEALASLEEVVADESMYVAAPVALETFLSRYVASLVEPPLPAADLRTDPAFRAPEPEPADDAFEKVVDLRPLEEERFDAPAPRVSARPPEDAPAEEPQPRRLAQERPADRSQRLFDPDEPFTVAVAPPAEDLHSSGGARRWVFACMVAMLVAGVGVAGYMGYSRQRVAKAAVAVGTLVVQSNPEGVEVFVDGVERGVTPARLTLAAGSHILELRGRGVPRVIPLTVTAGAEVSQYLEFAETPTTGALSVQSEPAGARVIVNGVERGIAPLTVTDLPAGQHEVELHADGSTVKHVIVIQAGAVASLLAPVAAPAAAPAGPVSGWLSVRAPFTVEIYEQGRLLATTDAERVMLAAGRHDLEFVNASLGLRIGRTVQVAPGKVTTMELELPRGSVNLNATPWAEVWIDGQRAGETPIGNLSLPVGPHEVVFRHPQLGEKRHAIMVTAGAPVRVSVDMK